MVSFISYDADHQSHKPAVNLHLDTSNNVNGGNDLKKVNSKWVDSQL